MGYIQRGFVYKSKKKPNLIIFILSSLLLFFIIYCIVFFFMDFGVINNNTGKLNGKVIIIYNNGLVNLTTKYNDIIIYSNSSFSFEKYYFDRILNRISFGLFIKNFDEKYHLNLYKIVGKSGDVVTIQKGKLFINNKFIKEIKLPIYYENIKFKLFDNELFCISIDNNDYFDSFVIGSLSKKNITGKIVY